MFQGLGSPSRGSRRTSIQDANARSSMQRVDGLQSPNRSYSNSISNNSPISANQRDELSQANTSRNSVNLSPASPIFSPRNRDHQLSFEEFQQSRNGGQNHSRGTNSYKPDELEPLHSSFEEPLPIEDLDLNDGNNVLNESFNSSSLPRGNSSTGSVHSPHDYLTVNKEMMEERRRRMQYEREEERRRAQELNDYLQKEAEDMKRKSMEEKFRTMNDYRKEFERTQMEREIAKENERRQKQTEREFIQKELQTSEKEEARRQRERKQQYCRELLAQIQQKKEKEEQERAKNRFYIPTPVSPQSDGSPSKDEERRRREQYRRVLNEQIHQQKQLQAKQRQREIELERRELQYTFLKGVGMSVEDYEKKRADMRKEFERTWQMEAEQRELQKMQEAEQARREKEEMEQVMRRIQEQEYEEYLQRKEAERELARALQEQTEHAQQQKRLEKERDIGYLDSLQFPSSPERYRPGSRPTTPGTRQPTTPGSRPSSRPQTASPLKSPHSRPRTPFSEQELTTTYRSSFNSSPTKTAWN